MSTERVYTNYQVQRAHKSKADQIRQHIPQVVARR